MWPVQNSGKGIFCIATLISVFGQCHSQAPGGYPAVLGGYPEAANKSCGQCGQDRIYFPRTGKCYRVLDRQGPCGELMKFDRSAVNRNIGECKCQEPAPTTGSRAVRPLIFVEQHFRCFPIYHQGPCQHGEWLVVGKEDVGVCERIPCPERYYAQPSSGPTELPIGNSTFVFAIHGVCFITGDPCSTDDPEKSIFFKGVGFNPVCEDIRPARSSVSAAGISGDNSCGDGTDEDGSGGCDLRTFY